MRRRRSSVRLCRLPSPVPSGHRRPHTAGGLRRPGLARLRAGFRREQSENVYENKGVGKKVVAGADVAFERLRCAEGAVRSNCVTCADLSLRDIANPIRRGLRQSGLAWLRTGFDGNKARMSMKTKDRCGELLRTTVALTFRSAGLDEPRLTCRPEGRRYIANYRTCDEFGHLVRLDVGGNANCPYLGCMWVVRVF